VPIYLPERAGIINTNAAMLSEQESERRNKAWEKAKMLEEGIIKTTWFSYY